MSAAAATTTTSNNSALSGDTGDDAPLTREITNAEKFFMYFQAAVTDIQDQLTRLRPTATSSSANSPSWAGERTDALEYARAGIARLSDAVRAHGPSIPAHDRRTYADAVAALYDKLAATRREGQPRQKFAFQTTGGKGRAGVFTARKNASAISLSDAEDMAERGRREVPGFWASSESSGVGTPLTDGSLGVEQGAGDEDMGARKRVGDEAVESPRATAANTQEGASHCIRLPSISYSSSHHIPPVKIADHTNAHIILPPSARHATTAASLANLRRCVVDLSSHSLPTTTHEPGQPFASLSLKSLRDSLILGGRVAGPIHATDVQNCVLVIEEARQFRLHSSRDCHVYLRVSSRPVIEGCERIAFAPFPGGDGEGLWEQVDDFQWLRTGERSPNWRVLDEGERIRGEVLEAVGRIGAGRDVEEILGNVGLGGRGMMHG